MDDNKMIAGFVKGTLVRVDGSDFWKPIEEIQVGDMVLSIPENGIGEPVFKRVFNTFKFENKEIWYVGVYDLDQDISELDNDDLYSLSGYFGTTANHPFLVIGKGSQEVSTEVNGKVYKGWTVATPESFVAYDKPEWKRTNELKFNDVLFNPKTGKKYCVTKSCPMYKFNLTRTMYSYENSERLAWINSRPLYSRLSNLTENKLYELGTLYDMDFINDRGRFKLVDGSITNTEMQLTDNYKDGYQLYTDTVYNIEVEDNHTYMVGTGNIVVHNSKNIGKI